MTERVALVSGASKGLGREIVENLCRDGFFVYALARQSSELSDLDRELRRSRPGGQAVICDLADSQSLSDALNVIEQPVDTIVHNVGGTIGIRQPLFSANDFQSVLNLNFLAAVELNHRLIPKMQSKGFGRVIHISSLASVENHGSVAYATTKAMLNSYVRSLGTALHGSGVVLTSILPGALAEAKSTAESKDKSTKISTRSVSDLVSFLASNKAAILSGSCIMADGGQGSVIPDWLV